MKLKMKIKLKAKYKLYYATNPKATKQVQPLTFKPAIKVTTPFFTTPVAA